LFAQTPLEISAMDKTDLSSISIDFNNILSFKNLSLKNNTLIIPSYKSNNKEYFYFAILDRNLKNKIIEEIKNKNIEYKTDENKVEYTINKFYIPQNPKTVKAFVSVIFNDKIEVNCNVLNGKYGLWVAWPSKKENNKWTKMFAINDKELKNKIEKEIIELFNKKAKDDITKK
ncbi:MAG: septation protein SpoVG family protein, partial [Elusimicrobia bacterium]|nr:septation protein SpoVG family protein [Elusimicrobiota bacterium]